MGAFLLRHWFLIGLALVIALAAWQPWIGAPGGPLWPELTVHLAVAGAFLVSGLTLPVAHLRAAAGQMRLHLVIQVICFVIVPLLVWLAQPLLAVCGASAVLIQGFVVLACMPTTIASCVIFTRTAGGNEPGALCNAVLGNLLGLVVTPALLLVLLDVHGESPILRVLKQLSLDVLLPLVAGQVIRLAMARWVAWFEQLRQIPSILLLYLILCVFSATFAAPMPSDAGRDITIALLGSVALHGLLLLGCWWVAGWRWWAFARGDRIAVLFCASQKTISLGIPMLSILYAQHPQLAWLTLPLICYHPLQLVIGGVLVGRLRKA